jgi:hypothetical protein
MVSPQISQLLVPTARLCINIRASWRVLILTKISGNDIADLVLEVQYQTKERLNVKIYPKHITPETSAQYILPASIVSMPTWDGSTSEKTSDLELDWR